MDQISRAKFFEHHKNYEDRVVTHMTSVLVCYYYPDMPDKVVNGQWYKYGLPWTPEYWNSTGGTKTRSDFAVFIISRPSFIGVERPFINIQAKKVNLKVLYLVLSKNL